ncbi:uncharacterized protein BCR38DRAFT_448540 [Pseudomassariella vexata]|uniref:Uncharacterized protein n=1 Tax=Pseudomassariella vexata TaxID=1141098 RepID=A0A1Y2DER1_9PEZI|nr:uncharacterized protein BCR38DRAFT_448540 [Pseudomassariella vexata]ORY57729.1 hypothetical protein BCR38DRAFT_448540 [Pseudomassariella vexata]
MPKTALRAAVSPQGLTISCLSPRSLLSPSSPRSSSHRGRFDHIQWLRSTAFRDGLPRPSLMQRNSTAIDKSLRNPSASPTPQRLENGTGNERRQNRVHSQTQSPVHSGRGASSIKTAALLSSYEVGPSVQDPESMVQDAKAVPIRK